MASFGYLPLELYQEIFEYLDIEELLNIRLVNKKCKEIIQHFKIRELIFDASFKYKYNWYFSNRSTLMNNVIKESKLFMLKNSLFNLEFLRRLKIDCLKDNSKISLKDINKLFIHLHQLDIYLYFCTKNENRLLDLPNLQILTLAISNSCYEQNYKLRVNAPKLHVLELDSQLRFVDFEHPLTIKHLKQNGDFYFNLRAFKNLEYIEFFSLKNYYFKQIKIDLLKMFPNLKYLLLELDNYSILSTILEKSVEKKRELNVYFKSIQFRTADELAKFNRTYAIKFHFLFDTLSGYLKYFDRTANNLDFINEISYSRLMDLIELYPNLMQLPANFFAKYSNIQKVYVEKAVGKQNEFISFLTNCKNLGYLAISNSELDQSFFNRLCNITNLIELEINEQRDEKLDLQFIFRMYKLNQFKTNQEMSMEELKKFDSSTNRLYKIRFNVNLSIVSLEKLNDKVECKYYLKNEQNNRLFNKKMNFSEICKWLKVLNKDEQVRTTRSRFKKVKEQPTRSKSEKNEKVTTNSKRKREKKVTNKSKRIKIV